MRITRTSRFTCVVIIAIALQTAVAFAATVQVGTAPFCKGTLVHFSTITAAVEAVPSGSTVYVCPGTYPEQVSIISKQISLIGVQTTTGTPTITSPAGGLVANSTSLSSGNPIAAQILIQGAPGLSNVSNLSVDGSGNNVTGCSPPTIIGIYYQNSSGTVNHVATRNQL